MRKRTKVFKLSEEEIEINLNEVELKKNPHILLSSISSGVTRTGKKHICAHRKNISGTEGGGSLSKLANTEIAGIIGKTVLSGIIPNGDSDPIRYGNTFCVTIVDILIYHRYLRD